MKFLIENIFVDKNISRNLPSWNWIMYVEFKYN